uniref:butyrophilin subfamily 1 member A1-like isoform X1 n=1 Tax=Pristiophorus japonicus TaxID=55135 RepID=UPI00398E90A5
MKWKYFILIFLRIVPLTGGKFIITTPLDAVIATVGGDILLDCQLIPSERLEDMEVRWFRTEWSNPIHLYRKGQDQPDAQVKEYAGRTELFHDQFVNGNVSLLLKGVTVRDDGNYRCFVVSKALDAEGSVTLKVGNVGLEPVIKMAEYTGSGVKLVCASDDWFPEPTIEWLNGNGEKLQGVLDKPIVDSIGLLTVASSLQVSDDSENRYTCTIINALLDKRQEANLQIAGVFFPSVSGWLVAFWLMFLVALVSVGVVLFFYWKQREQDKKVRVLKSRPTIHEYEALNAKLEKEQALADQDKKTLLQQMEMKEQAAKLAYEQLLHTIAWDKMLRCAVSVSLDPDTANGNVDVSADRTTVRDSGGWKNVAENNKRFDRYPFVFATKGFDSGKHYWEVDVSLSSNWDLGVANQTVDRKGRITLAGENGYWTVGRSWEKYEARDKAQTAITVGQNPTKVGIFLNYDDGFVSFHNVDTKVSLHTFNVRFTETIFPLFCPWRSPEPIQITPVVLEE